MLSRVGDALYWLGRYTERTETNAHIVLTELDYILEQRTHDNAYVRSWSHVLAICGFENNYESKYSTFHQSDLIQYVLSDFMNPNAIVPLIHSVRFNLKNVRDSIPNELFEVWNELFLSMNMDYEKNARTVLCVTNFLNEVRKTALTSTGIIDSLMTRDEAFCFLKIGKWMERAEKTALIVYELIHDNIKEIPTDFAVNRSLTMTNAMEEYSRRFRSRDASDILNFLMKDRKCSRSVEYGIRKISQTIEDVEEGQYLSYTKRLFRAIEKIEELLKEDAHQLTAEERIEWIEEIRIHCTMLGPIFSQTYYLTPPISIDEKTAQIIS